jgi:myosin heavy subunit
VLSSQTLQGKLWTFIETNPENKGVSCCTHAVSLQRQLVSAMIASLLTIALAVQPEEPTIPCTLASALINKQRTLPPVLDRCLHSSDSPKSPSISLFQQANTPSTGQHLEDWRKRLNSELESQDAYKRDVILRSVGKVCGDLEARCKTVEEPLQREKEKSVRLEELIVELQSDVESLQARIVDNGCYQEILERERDEALEDKERTCVKLREIEASFTESKRHADEALRTAQEKFSAKELELRSVVLEYEEELRTRSEEAEALRDTINQLEESQAQQDTAHHTLKDQCAQFQTRLSDTEQLLHSERKKIHIQVEENARLEDQNRNCADRLEGMEAELEHVTRQLDDLTTSHQHLEVKSEETVKSLEAKHAHDMEAAAVKAEDQRKALGAQLQNALQDCQYEKDTLEKAQRHFQDLQASIPPLESRIQDLEDLCSEQEGELEELRTIRRNILVGLGVMPQKPMAIRSSSRSQQDAAEPETPRDSRSHQRRKSAINAKDNVPKATTGTQDVTDTNMENLPKASFASSELDTSQGGGPAPKRPKPRPSFKVPSMHTPYTQKPILTSNPLSRKLSPSKRSALRQMSPNRRHTNVGFAVAENEEEDGFNASEVVMKRRGSLQDMEQADFDMDDEFMAGTPLTQGNFMSGTGRMPEEGDETATEL